MWDWNYTFSIMPELLHAFLMTVYVTLAGFAVASVIGLILAVGARSRFVAVRIVVRCIVEFVRNTPLLVQVFFIFFSLPLLAGISLSAFATGVIGLGLHYATYLSEVYRSGIDGVPKGQWEAATALNMSKSRTWMSVVLPQALPPIVPMMGNYLIVMFKETPILMAVTVAEVLLAAKNIASVTYRVFEPYTIVGVLFLVVSVVVSLLFRRLEKRMNRTNGPVLKG